MKLTLISSLMTIINVHNNLLFQALLIVLNSLSAHIHCFFRINILTAMWHMQTDNDTFLFAIIPEGYCYMVLSNILWFSYGQKPCWNRMNKTFNNSRFKCIILILHVSRRIYIEIWTYRLVTDWYSILKTGCVFILQPFIVIWIMHWTVSVVKSLL